MRFGILNVVMMVMTLSPVARAQDGAFADEINNEATSLSRDVKKRDALEVRTVRAQNVRPATQETVVAEAPAQQPVYIIQAPPTSQHPQVEPTTTVEAKPIRETRSEQLRKQREEVERQNEDKLLEKLEDQRLLSEKERTDRILNPAATPAPQALGPVNPAPIQTYQEPVQVAPAPMYVAPAAPVVSAQAEDLKEDPKKQSRLSIGGLGGIGSYPSASNVNGVYAAGLELGIQFPEGLGLEVLGAYSTYDIQVNQQLQSYQGYGYSGYGGYGYSPYSNPYSLGQTVWTMKQVNIMAGADYQILDSRVTPVVGLLAGYTRRTYTQRLNIGYLPNNGEASGSSSFDGGFKLGVDVRATERLAVGASVRYLMNISNRTDDPLAYIGRYGTPIEELSYYFATINLKVLF